MPKLDRQHEYELNAHQTDRISLWDSLFHDDRQNLTLEDQNGKRVIAIYALTREQLSVLHREIGSFLESAQQGRDWFV